MTDKDITKKQWSWWILILCGWLLFLIVHSLATALRVYLIDRYPDPMFFITELPFFFLASIWIALGTLRLCQKFLPAVTSHILGIVLILVQLGAAIPCWMVIAFQVHLWAGGNL
ncbi:MAG: hypothetical protein PHI84_12410 [Kiritimatiellae bacterium]|nr:hypothetical protein [Kiritimatiellia bacterium]